MQNDPQTLQDTVATLAERVQKLEQGAGAPPTHYHNGFDSNNVSFSDIVNRKLYVHHVLPGVTAALPANYGTFLIVPVACLVTRIQEVHETAGNDAGAVTINVEKLTGTQAPGAGSGILSSTINLKGTANTVVTGTLTTTSSIRSLAAGDRLALLKTGTLTLVAGVTVLVELQF